MKTSNFLGKGWTFTAIALMGFVMSCGRDDEKLSATDATNAVSESVSDGYFEDADDMSLVAVTEGTSATRIATDDRLKCGDASNVTAGGNNTTVSGSFVIDFGTSCTDAKGNVRSGKVNVTYSGGPVGTEGFQVVVTFTNYYINGIKLEGTRTVTRLSSSEFKHSILLAGGKATWPDATFATRDANFVRLVNTGAGTVTITGGDGAHDASGTGRTGKSYTMDIQEPLVYKTECAVSDKIYMAVQGIKLFTNESGKTLTIDYGNGACDRNVALTVGKYTFNYSVSK